LSLWFHVFSAIFPAILSGKEEIGIHLSVEVEDLIAGRLLASFRSIIPLLPDVLSTGRISCNGKPLRLTIPLRPLSEM